MSNTMLPPLMLWQQARWVSSPQDGQLRFFKGARVMLHWEKWTYPHTARGAALREPCHCATLVGALISEYSARWFPPHTRHNVITFLTALVPIGWPHVCISFWSLWLQFVSAFFLLTLTIGLQCKMCSSYPFSVQVRALHLSQCVKGGRGFQLNRAAKHLVKEHCLASRVSGRQSSITDQKHCFVAVVKLPHSWVWLLLSLRCRARTLAGNIFWPE